MRRFRKTALALHIIITISFIVACNNMDDSVARLKQKIDKAEMVEYIDSVHLTTVKMLYPDFFSVKKENGQRAEFYYSDQDVKELVLSFHAIPPRIFENTEKALKIISDSLDICIKKRSDYFILKSEESDPSSFVLLTKYYRTKFGGWICVSILYEKKYEKAVTRLTKQVMKWKPLSDKLFPDMPD